MNTLICYEYCLYVHLPYGLRSHKSSQLSINIYACLHILITSCYRENTKSASRFYLVFPPSRYTHPWGFLFAHLMELIHKEPGNKP